GWGPFERFVFVMAVLEGYSPRECSALLGCPVQDVIEAKSLALQRLANRPWQGTVAPQRRDTPWNAGSARAQVACRLLCDLRPLGMVRADAQELSLIV